MTGTVGILNVGAGDVSISFDPANPVERIRSARIVRDMLRRGYALLIEVDRDGEKRFERSLDFDEAQCRYIIADFDPVTAALSDAKELEEAHDGEQSNEATASAPDTGEDQGKGRRGRKRTVDAGSTRAVAIGRSAGG